MADFPSSTHCQRWILQRKALVDKSHASNQRAQEALTKYGATRVDVLADGSLVYPEMNETNGSGKKGPLPEPLTVQEENMIRKFYEQKIQQATAILYFKRFYLQWSVMEHDPKHIMLTCIYISCKVEEFHVSADELGKGIQQDPQMLLKNELTVLQGLQFELIVYAPYRSLDGYVFDLESFVQGTGVTLKAVQDLRHQAVFEIDSMLLTDAPLLFPPGQANKETLRRLKLAMAALRRANREDRKVDLERFFERTVRSLRKQTRHGRTGRRNGRD